MPVPPQMIKNSTYKEMLYRLLAVPKLKKTTSAGERKQSDWRNLLFVPRSAQLKPMRARKLQEQMLVAGLPL